MSDTKRLVWLMNAAGIDGVVGDKKDRYDYASEVATEEGHDEPTPSDELEGFRRCIDAGMKMDIPS